MALVLLTTVPSGAPRVVELRDQLLNLLSPVPVPPPRPGRAECRHSDDTTEAWPEGVIYTGLGRLDVQGRPSPYANPFVDMPDPAGSLHAFSKFLFSRADLETFLAPLRGCTLVCDCAFRGPLCHTELLATIVNEEQEPVEAPAASANDDYNGKARKKARLLSWKEAQTRQSSSSATLPLRLLKPREKCTCRMRGRSSRRTSLWNDLD